MRLLFCNTVIVLFLMSCSDTGKRDIRAYYYPVKDLQPGKVYEYQTKQNDAATPEFWYFQTFPSDSGLFLTATYYDRNYQIGQIMREKIVKSGSIARDYFLYEPDNSSGKVVQIPTTIQSPSVFPFQVSDSTGIFLFSLTYHPPEEPGATISIIRNRYFLGDAPDFEFKGKKYPCIRMGIREAIGSETEGISEIKGSGEEWYAKGLGLVGYRKTYGRGAYQLESRLVDIFPMSDLVKRAGGVFDQQ